MIRRGIVFVLLALVLGGCSLIQRRAQLVRDPSDGSVVYVIEDEPSAGIDPRFIRASAGLISGALGLPPGLGEAVAAGIMGLCGMGAVEAKRRRDLKRLRPTGKESLQVESASEESQA